jgi:predicted Zn-dependent protease
MPAVGLTGTLVYAYYAFLEEAPLTKRKRWIATDPQFERSLGDQQYKNLLHQFRGQILPPNHPASRTVQRVGSRIAKASQVFAQQHPHTNISPSPYTYTVVRSDMANAFVLPNNHVFVLTGLFKYVRDEDELAAVLGHETAHNLARHAGERMSGGIIMNIFARMTLLLDPTGVLAALMLPAAALLHTLPNSREAEIEADQIGVYLAAEACYDPRAAKRVFQAMRDGTRGAPPEFMSTHPSHDTRIQNFDQWIPDAMKTYDSDMGDRCRQVREDMAQARIYEAQLAQARIYEAQQANWR